MSESGSSEASSPSDAIPPEQSSASTPAAAQEFGWASPDSTATAQYPQQAQPQDQLPPAAAYPGFPPPGQTPATPTTPGVPTMPVQPMQGAPTGQPYYGPPAPGQPYYAPPAPGQPYYGQTGYVAPPPPPPAEPKATLADRKRKHKRVLWIATASVVVLALAAVGLRVSSSHSGNSIVAKVTCNPTSLESCLIKSPAGAEQIPSAGAGTDSDLWLTETTATADLYGSQITDDAAGVSSDTTTLLTADGLKNVVHTDWSAFDGNDVDLVLLDFGSQKGAQAWNDTRSAEIAAGYAGQSVAIPGDSAAKAHAGTQTDSTGSVDAAYSAVVGTIVLDVSYASPKQFSAPDLESWAGTELASLRTAPAPGADPDDAKPVGTQQVVCATLSSCLMPMPSGAERWTNPSSSKWVKSLSLTNSQYVQLTWRDDTAEQPGVLADFTSDGVKAIGHDDWEMDDADKQADIYLIQTINSSSATSLGRKYFGQPDWGPGMTSVGYAIPDEPGAQAWYSSKKDAQGFTDFAFNTTIGNVVVDGWMFFYGSFDASTATRWSQTELSLITQSLTTQDLGRLPLTAPTLPAAAQGTCPSAADCLLPLPASATDTTSTSYNAPEAVNAAAYSLQDESSMSDDYSTWLAADGFQSANHRSWTGSNGATADAVLLKYANPAQAQAATSFEYGANAVGNRVCTDAAVPDSLCLALPVSDADPQLNETVWVTAWKGDYEVSIHVTASDTADVADAYTWAQQQLDLLPAS